MSDGRWFESRFFVRPLDVAFFGPPEAQSAGETHSSRTLFPPPPRTFQGLVRTQLLRGATPPLDLSDQSRRARDERAALVGGPDHLPTGWQIEGPLPAVSAGEGPLVPWVPTPLFLRRIGQGLQPEAARWIDAAGDDHILGGAFPSNLAAESSSATGQRVQGAIGVSGFDDRGPLGGWLSASNLAWALSGAPDTSWDARGHAPELPPLVRREPRMGLALDADSRSAQDRMLYAREELRFDGRGGFLGAFRGTLPSSLSSESLHQGTAAFGRGHRLAELCPADNLDPWWERIYEGKHLPEAPDDGARFWMLLIAPARLERPLHPVVEGCELEVLGAVLDKPLTLGGYSMATRQARPNQHYVPAGSAWLFRFPPGVEAERRGRLLRSMNGSCCLGPSNERQMGFGQILIGLDGTQRDFRGRQLLREREGE